jgi:hypothetical protein
MDDDRRRGRVRRRSGGTVAGIRLSTLIGARVGADLQAGCEQAAVGTENSVQVDLVTESPNVRDAGRAILLLADAFRHTVQVEKPT